MYPIPSATLMSIATRRGCNLSDTATQEILASASFNLALADVYNWLSLAPEVTQGGQHFAFTDVQRQNFDNRAQGLYTQLAADDSAQVTIYGYKGDRL